MQLYVLRHGQTEWNATGRMQGQLDSPLTEQGKQDALAAAELLRDLDVGFLGSSDLGRCKETAAIVGAVIGRTIDGCFSEFRESDVGVLAGKTKAEAQEAFPHYFGPDGRILPCETISIEGSEDEDALRARVRRGLDRLASELHATIGVLVTHEGVIKILDQLLGAGRRLNATVGPTAHGQLVEYEFPSVPTPRFAT